MNGFSCPVCGKLLLQHDKTMGCENGHGFDISRSGYCNLLLSQQSKKKQHGDDKMMVVSRRDFLDKGYYSNLRTALCEAVVKFMPQDGVLLDAGCGECYYTAAAAQSLREADKKADVFGIDISKDALTAGKKREAAIHTAVASIFKIPMQDNSCDVVLNVFAPVSAPEYVRVLKTGGILILAVPLELHLWEMKCRVYDKPYENDAPNARLEGFELLEKREMKNRISLACNADIRNLFSMTPYVHKTGKSDIARLEALETLDTATEFGVLIFRKT